MGWVVSLQTRLTGWKSQIAGWFIDREFFMRANGQVRFLKISAQLQRRVAGVTAFIVGAWLIVTLGMAVNQVSVSIERMALNEKEAKVESAEERVANYRGSIDEVTKDLERRQKMLESLSDQYLDEIPAAAATGTDAAAQDDKTVKTISALVPEAAGLARIEARQIRFAELMTKVAQARTQKAEAAIRQFGLNPDILARQATSAQGGPFESFFGSSKKGCPRSPLHQACDVAWPDGRHGACLGRDPDLHARRRHDDVERLWLSQRSVHWRRRDAQWS